MATNAVTGKSTVVYRGRLPRGGAMTNVTFLGGDDMSRILAASNNAIMTTATHSQHLPVIDFPGWLPQCGADKMTGLAGIRGIYMCGIFARGNHAIVAVHADPKHLRVVHRAIGDRSPSGWRFFMAQIASIGARNVIARFAARDATVMAINTIIDKAAVIGRHVGYYPAIRGMAGIALFIGNNVIVRLT